MRMFTIFTGVLFLLLLSNALEGDERYENIVFDDELEVITVSQSLQEKEDIDEIKDIVTIAAFINTLLACIIMTIVTYNDITIKPPTGNINLS
uniref:Hypotheticial protein n=1 Tax=Strongyloides venezuelensis TaxID=75913 RepID=A0A0K0G0X0_STRVS